VDAGTIALYVFAGMGLVGSLFVVFAFGVHGASVSRLEYHRPAPPTTANERIQPRNERNVGENERIRQTYRHRLERAGVTVPAADTVLDQPVTSAIPAISSRKYGERTSTLEASESAVEEGGTLQDSSYDDWKRAVVNGQCDTIVRDMRIWLQDVGVVEQGKGKQAQALAESYLSQALNERFIREIPGWVSGMRRKYEWTGQGAMPDKILSR